MKLIINNPQLVFVEKDFTKYVTINPIQLTRIVEKLLLTKSIIPEGIEVFEK